METRPRRYGAVWRRDGDDDDPHADEPAIHGPWRLGHVPSPGGVYASRRRCRGPQVWLLARRFTDPDHTHHPLAGLVRGHMLEPNSLHAVHHAACTARAPSTRRRTGDQDWR